MTEKEIKYMNTANIKGLSDSQNIRQKLKEKQVSFRIIKKRMPWSAEEDRAITELVNMYGTGDWTLIALEMKIKFGFDNRTGKQCRERWHNHLDPKINKEYWSEKEEHILFSKHAEFGNKWSEIARFLPGRTDNSIKNHFYSKLRKYIRKTLKQLNKDELVKKYGINANKLDCEFIYKLIRDNNMSLAVLNKENLIKLLINSEKEQKSSNGKQVLKKKRHRGVQSKKKIPKKDKLSNFSLKLVEEVKNFNKNVIINRSKNKFVIVIKKEVLENFQNKINELQSTDLADYFLNLKDVKDNKNEAITFKNNAFTLLDNHNPLISPINILSLASNSANRNKFSLNFDHSLLSSVNLFVTPRNNLSYRTNPFKFEIKPTKEINLQNKILINEDDSQDKAEDDDQQNSNKNVEMSNVLNGKKKDTIKFTKNKDLKLDVDLINMNDPFKFNLTLNNTNAQNDDDKVLYTNPETKSTIHNMNTNKSSSIPDEKDYDKQRESPFEIHRPLSKPSPTATLFTQSTLNINLPNFLSSNKTLYG